MQGWNKVFCVLDMDQSGSMNAGEMQTSIMAMSHMGFLRDTSQPIDEAYERVLDHDSTVKDAVLAMGPGQVVLLGEEPLVVRGMDFAFDVDFNVQLFRCSENMSDFSVLCSSYGGDAIALKATCIAHRGVSFFVADNKSLEDKDPDQACQIYSCPDSEQNPIFVLKCFLPHTHNGLSHTDIRPTT